MYGLNKLTSIHIRAEYKQIGWYSGADVMRIWEPVVGLPLNFGVILNSGIFDGLGSNATRNWWNMLIAFAFIVGAAVYEQGAGFHSASNMFQNALSADDSVMKYHDDDNVRTLYYWMRTVWEHLISHYIYATGYAVMALAQMLAYSNYNHISKNISPITWLDWAIAFISMILYALLILAVAADFPSGTIVGLIYTGAYGIIGITTFAYFEDKKNAHMVPSNDSQETDFHAVNQTTQRDSENQDSPSTNNTTDAEAAASGGVTCKIIPTFLQRRPILLYFIGSYSLGNLFIWFWIASVRGFYSRSEAKVMTHYT